MTIGTTITLNYKRIKSQTQMIINMNKIWKMKTLFIILVKINLIFKVIKKMLNYNIQYLYQKIKS